MQVAGAGQVALAAACSAAAVAGCGSPQPQPQPHLGRERLVKAALVLTLTQAVNAFARAAARDWKLSIENVDVVLEEKRQTVR